MGYPKIMKNWFLYVLIHGKNMEKQWFGVTIGTYLRKRHVNDVNGHCFFWGGGGSIK